MLSSVFGRSLAIRLGLVAAVFVAADVCVFVCWCVSAQWAPLKMFDVLEAGTMHIICRLSVMMTLFGAMLIAE